MIRISGGKFRGQTIASPKNKAVRPTTGLVRESLFSMLQQDLPGCRFLDLFAGSGLMGVEAVSRGAALVLAIEKNREHLKLIQQNYAKLQLSAETAKPILMDVFKFAERKNTQSPFDIVFADPPYGLENLETLVRDIEQNDWLSEDGIIIIENTSNFNLENFTQRQFGDTSLFIKRA